MNVAYINPFIESVGELFTTMLGCSARRGAVAVDRGRSAAQDVTALIGLSGPVRGTVALAFPAGTARAMVARMTGQEAGAVEESLSDGLAELVNIVAGGAKARLNGGAGPLIDLSLPTVVRGEKYDIERISHSVWLEVPFASELGPFTLRVTLQQIGAQIGVAGVAAGEGLQA